MGTMIIVRINKKLRISRRSHPAMEARHSQPEGNPGSGHISTVQNHYRFHAGLKYLNMGEYAKDVIDVERNYKYTLQRLFRHVIINLSPYDDKYPVEEDPISVFQEGFIINTDIQSNPSLSPTSTASTILMEDIGQI